MTIQTGIGLMRARRRGSKPVPPQLKDCPGIEGDEARLLFIAYRSVFSP